MESSKPYYIFGEKFNVTGLVMEIFAKALQVYIYISHTRSGW